MQDLEDQFPLRYREFDKVVPLTAEVAVETEVLNRENIRKSQIS